MSYRLFLKWASLLTTLFVLTNGLCPAGLPDPGTSLVTVVHKSNLVASLSANQLRALYLGETTQWSDHKRVILVRREPSSAAFGAVLLKVLKMSAAEYRRFIISLEFRGDEPLSLKTLNSNEAACNFVFNVPSAVAVLDQSALSDPGCSRVKTLPVLGLGGSVR